MGPRYLPALLATLVLGCGGETTGAGSGTDAGGDGTANDGTTGRDSPAPPPIDAPPPLLDVITLDTPSPRDAPVPWSPVCPASPPSMGTGCPSALNNTSCEYDCGVVLVCAGGTWGGSVDSFFCPGPNPAACPSGISGIMQGNACTSSGETCAYSTGVCQCNAPFDPTPDAGATWWCGPGHGCPMPRPRVGSACTMGGQTCIYEPCGGAQTCVDGIWQPEPIGCGA